jgi:hypothetical protein
MKFYFWHGRQAIINMVRHLIQDLTYTRECDILKEEKKILLERCGICANKGATFLAPLGKTGVIVGAWLGSTIGCLWHALAIKQENLKQPKIITTE